MWVCEKTNLINVFFFNAFLLSVLSNCFLCVFVIIIVITIIFSTIILSTLFKLPDECRLDPDYSIFLSNGLWAPVMHTGGVVAMEMTYENGAGKRFVSLFYLGHVWPQVDLF